MQTLNKLSAEIEDEAAQSSRGQFKTRTNAEIRTVLFDSENNHIQMIFNSFMFEVLLHCGSL